MSISVDHLGNAHRGAGTPGAGQFTARQNPAPESALTDGQADFFDEQEWRERMEAIIDDGEPEDQDPIGPQIDIFDRDSWDGGPF